jgi:hypothetical protein
MRGARLETFRAGLPLVFALLAAGCEVERPFDATTVLSDEHCHGLAAGVTQIAWTDVDALRQGNMLGDPPAGGGARDEDLLLFAISRGEQPTGGFVMRLEATRREPGAAVIDIHWAMPAPDVMVAQVITHPCLVVGVTRDDLEGLDRVEVRDQHGTVVGSANR